MTGDWPTVASVLRDSDAAAHGSSGASADRDQEPAS
jgi:hypothetical protein